MKEKNPYFYLANSQLFPFTATNIPVSTDNELLLKAQEALQLIAEEQLDAALTLYSKMIASYPELPFFYACRSILNAQLGDDEGAFYDYQVAKKIDPNYHNFLEWQENKATMLHAQELNEINDDINNKPPTVQSYINRGMLWVQHFEYDNAIEDLSMALSMTDTAEIRVSRAAIFMRMLCYDMALMDLNAAIELNPALFTAYLYRAKLHVCIKEDKEALIDFEHALAISADNAEVYEERAAYYERIENWAAAVADYNSLIAHNPLDFYPYVLRADVYERLGEPQHAIQDYDEAIRLNPHYSDLYQYRGELKQKLGDTLGAKQDFDTFEELEEE